MSRVRYLFSLTRPDVVAVKKMVLWILRSGAAVGVTAKILLNMLMLCTGLPATP
jgi:hypothetical protein